MKSSILNDGFTVVGGQRDSLLDSLREIWRFRPLILELVRRDLKVRYKNRVGGILWSLFPPLLQVLTITIMVKFFLNGPANYSAYLMPVMFLWQFFQNTVLDSAQSLISNAQLVRKIYFPRAILPIVTLLSNLLHFCITLVFIVGYYFVMPIGEPIYPQNARPEWWMLLPVTFCVGALALGVGYLLTYLASFYDDVRFLSVTFLGLFFYLIPILYPVERVAERPEIFSFYMLNPMASLLVGFQRALLGPIGDIQGVAPLAYPWGWIGLAFCTSALTLCLGFACFERSKWAIMERL